MELTKIVSILAGLLVSSATSQTILNEQVLSTFMFTMYGDRTPFALPAQPILTPLGAQQLYSVGQFFRNRYIGTINGSNPEGTAIYGISPYVLDNQALTIASTNDQYTVASALAFMQGLYPGLELSSENTIATSPSLLANGSDVRAPLSDYQYPQLYTASPLDLNSIWISGQQNCPAYISSEEQYWESTAYVATLEENEAFYTSLIPTVLGGILPNASVGYFDAYDIWDYVQYGVTHNETIAAAVSDADLVKLRILADDIVFQFNGNLSVSGPNPGDKIRAIAGRTLATRLVENLYTNINTQGAYQKMSMFFGSYEPMISLFALLGLPSMQNQEFYSIPEPGATIVFELFTFLTDTSTNTDVYPSDNSNLFIRFLYLNGTGDGAELTQYPLFGADPNNMYMSLEDFAQQIEGVMMLSIADWCSECGSFSIFCPAFSESNSDGSGLINSPKHGLSPVIAGVIGALVTLVVLALIMAAAMLLAGVRFFRVKNKRRSELAGFKGAEKLASDQDLTIPKGGAGVVVSEGAPVPGRGHERVGSWELKDSGKAEEGQLPIDRVTGAFPRRPSYEDDLNNLHPVRPKDQI